MCFDSFGQQAVYMRVSCLPATAVPVTHFLFKPAAGYPCLLTCLFSTTGPDLYYRIVPM